MQSAQMIQPIRKVMLSKLLNMRTVVTLLMREFCLTQEVTFFVKYGHGFLNKSTQYNYWENYNYLSWENGKACSVWRFIWCGDLFDRFIWASSCVPLAMQEVQLLHHIPRPRDYRKAFVSVAHGASDIPGADPEWGLKEGFLVSEMPTPRALWLAGRHARTSCSESRRKPISGAACHSREQFLRMMLAYVARSWEIQKTRRTWMRRQKCLSWLRHETVSWIFVVSWLKMCVIRILP